MRPPLLPVFQQRCQQHRRSRRQQSEQRKFTHAGREGKQVARHERRFLNGEDDAQHALPPRHVYYESSLFDFIGKLQHCVDTATGCKGQILDGTHQNENEEGLCNSERRSDSKECRTHCHGRHKIGQKCEVVGKLCKFGASAFCHCVTDENTQRTCNQCAGNCQQ